MDANSKLGPQLIPGYAYQTTKNGKVLECILERHAMCVVNGLRDKRQGLITREKLTVNGIEKKHHRLCNNKQ